MSGEAAAAPAGAPRFDESVAIREGWNIFDSFGSSGGPWQVCKIDAPEEWEGNERAMASEDEAWEHVVAMTFAGSDYHAGALAFVREHNRPEYDAIVAWTCGRSATLGAVRRMAVEAAVARAGRPLWTAAIAA